MRLLLFLMIAIGLVAPAFADETSNDPNSNNFIDTSHITGTNTARADYYDTKGDKNSSPYRYPGWQFYNDFNFNMTYRQSHFEIFRGQLSGTYSSSYYRSPDNGLLLERFNLLKESGSTSLPYRLEAGDIFGFFSLRSMQKSLKGIALELQPLVSSAKIKQSVIIISGINQPTWMHFNSKKGTYTSGLSYLLDASTTKASLNLVRNARNGDLNNIAPARIQDIYSAGLVQSLELATEKLTFETEAAYFRGDHDWLSGIATGHNKSALAFYAQLSGKSNSPLTYRLRYEETGDNYRPDGASVTPNRQAKEAHVGWSFKSGQQLRIRLQNFRDNFRSPNPNNTNSYGINLSGPLFAQAITGNVDAFISDVHNQSRTSDFSTQNINANLNFPLFLDLRGRTGLQYQHTDNKLAVDSVSKQANFAVDSPIEIHGFKGIIAPGLTVRKSQMPQESLDIMPTFAANLAKGPHRLAYNLSYQSQDRLASANNDIKTISNNFNYSYSLPQDTITFEYISQERDPRPGANMVAHKVSIFWTHQFDKKPKPTKVPVTAKADVVVPAEALNLKNFAPGMDLQQTKEILKKSNITASTALPNIVVYEAKFFDEIDQRQRLALVYDKAGNVQKSAVIVDFANIGSPDDLIQTFEKVRKALIYSYGRPSYFYEKGDVNAQVFDNIKNGSFIRIMQWQLPRGIIQLGIPRRLDGQVRIEVHYAPSFPPVTETIWGIEEVR